MDVSKIGLLRSSSEESFEHIDADFDATYYPELRGEAVADFTPREKGQIMIKREQAVAIVVEEISKWKSPCCRHCQWWHCQYSFLDSKCMTKLI